MRRRKAVRITILLAVLALTWSVPEKSSAQFGAPRLVNAPKHVLFVYGNVPHAVAISTELIRVLPHVTIEVIDTTKNKPQKYSGVPLAVLIAKAGVSIDKNTAAKPSTFSIVAIGDSGKQIVLSPTETDSLLRQSNTVIVADVKNGKPLNADEGPLQLIIALGNVTPRMVSDLTRIRIDSAK